MVYNHNLLHELMAGDDTPAAGPVDLQRCRWAFASNELLVKVQYALRY